MDVPLTEFKTVEIDTIFENIFFQNVKSKNVQLYLDFKKCLCEELWETPAVIVSSFS